MKVTFTDASVKKEIASLEARLQFLRNLLGYFQLTEESAVPTVALAAAEEKKGVRVNVGVRANLLRFLHGASGAQELETICKHFPPEKRKVVLNALGTLRRAAHIRETAKGRVELTTAGLAEAAWYSAHPLLSKRAPGSREAKK